MILSLCSSAGVPGVFVRLFLAGGGAISPSELMSIVVVDTLGCAAIVDCPMFGSTAGGFVLEDDGLVDT